MYKIADSIEITSDEGGFELHITSTLGDKYTFNINNVAEELYEKTKAELWPWLYEMWEAKREQRDQERFVALDPATAFPGPGPYEITDPKHPDHHSVMTEIFDSREGK